MTDKCVGGGRAADRPISRLFSRRNAAISVKWMGLVRGCLLFSAGALGPVEQSKSAAKVSLQLGLSSDEGPADPSRNILK